MRSPQEGEEGGPNGPDSGGLEEGGKGIPVCGSPVPEPATVFTGEVDPGTVSDFVSEAREHLEQADVQLLRLETERTCREPVDAVFRVFHTIKGLAAFLGFQDLRGFAHKVETLLEVLRAGRLEAGKAEMDVLFAAVDIVRRMVAGIARFPEVGGEYPVATEREDLLARVQVLLSGDPLSDFCEPPLPGAAPGRRVGDILVESGLATPEAVEQAARVQSESGGAARIGECLVRQGSARAHDVALALRSQGHPPPAVSIACETVKVDAGRLDRLLETVGELAIAGSMLFLAPELAAGCPPRLRQNLVRLERLTRELQSQGTGLRLVPVRPLFRKMARLVRDLASLQDKPVDLVAEGEEVELDRSLVERLGDPLMHMVRNAVDHGIERDPARRLEQGKPYRATIRLVARQRGEGIEIEVSDDGRGLDRAAILAKAAESGLAPADGAGLSDEDVWALLFRAGFSTAEAVTDVSGRGVGLDVVKRSIEGLRGHIAVSTVAGAGTTFHLRLPLTLAVVDGMLVRVGEERCILPKSAVVRAVHLSGLEVSTLPSGGRVLLHQETLVPLCPLALHLGLPADPHEGTMALIVESSGTVAGLVVDELLGQQQIVVKSLGGYLGRIPGISGGGILPDGRVGMVLDVERILAELGASPGEGREGLAVRNARRPGGARRAEDGA